MFVTTILLVPRSSEKEGAGGEGRLRREVERLLEGCADEVLVVAGGEAVRRLPRLEPQERVRFHLDPNLPGEERQLLRAGLLESRPETTHYIVLPFGSERVSAGLVDRLLSAFLRSRKSLLIVFRRRRSAYPVLLTRRIRRELLNSEMQGWLRGTVLRDLSRALFLRLGPGESLREIKVLEGPRLSRLRVPSPRV